MFFTKFYQKVWTFPDFISEPLCGIFGPLIQTGLTQGTRVECFIFLLCFINLLIISRYNDRRYDLEDILVSWYFTTDSGKAGSAVALNVILPQRGKNVEDDVFLKTSSSTTTLSVSYSYRSESTIRYCKKLAAHMDRVAHNQSTTSDSLRIQCLLSNTQYEMLQLHSLLSPLLVILVILFNVSSSQVPKLSGKINIKRGLLQGNQWEKIQTLFLPFIVWAAVNVMKFLATMKQKQIKPIINCSGSKSNLRTYQELLLLFSSDCVLRKVTITYDDCFLISTIPTMKSTTEIMTFFQSLWLLRYNNLYLFSYICRRHLVTVSLSCYCSFYL